MRDSSPDLPAREPAGVSKYVLLRVYRDIYDDRILANAAGVAFYTLLALFPGIAALVSVYGLFADPAAIGGGLDAVSGILPSGGVTVIKDQLAHLSSQGSGSLTIGFTTGILISLWSANGGIKALFDALNVVYRERERRGFLEFHAVTLAFTIAMIAFLIVAMTCIVAVPAILGYLPSISGRVIDLARWPLMGVLVAIALAFVYRYGPCRGNAEWRWISWGSGTAALGWLAVSALFSYYAANFGTFNKTYGSLGAIIGFMLWIWLSVIVVLLGAKLDAEIEYETARDTMAGRPGPLGRRGA
ncbi:MAG TPA: YihY/virulence factor BrkB family protein [Stellaceae bacterium]|nr:YihY/virulence factor BrkB family protein [Stellaceae bacterium]